MNRSLRLLAAALVLTACHHGGKPEDEPEPVQEPARPLANLAGQRTIVTPSFYVTQGDALGWAAQIPKPREYMKQLDEEIATVLADRGLKTMWTYPADLVRASKSNPTYAVDPYSIGANVLRGNIASGAKLGDPLTTQLRTMIALQEGARAVLVPVELHFEKAPTVGQGIAVLKIALLDGRLGDVRWVGYVRSEPSSTLSRAVLTSVAAHLADLITAQ
ncbi:MAG: hypothetical protein ABIY52_03865 [Gemmatimonadaceae bacterium]